MKIALVSPYDYPYPGGVTAHISHLEENFTRMGHTVKIIAPSSGKENMLARQNVIVVGRPVSIPANGSVARITLSFRLAGQVKTILREERFDVVHLHEPLLPALPVQVLRFSNSINIGTFHAYSGKHLAYHYGRRILKRWFHRLDGKIAVSRPAMEFVCQYFPGYYNIIPNGIDYQKFSTPLEPLGEFNDGKLNILFVGRLEKRKGLVYLLQAFAHVKKEFPASRLIIVGDGGLREGYKRWVRKKELSDVIFTGRAPEEEIPRYYQAAHVFCSPATGQESFGIVLLEAMAAGKPIVASNIEGYAGLVSSGVEGFLVEPKNGEALALALIRLLRDSSLRERMGEAGKSKAKEYNWHRVASNVLAYYERILSEKYPRSSLVDVKLITANNYGQ